MLTHETWWIWCKTNRNQSHATGPQHRITEGTQQHNRCSSVNWLTRLAVLQSADNQHATSQLHSLPQHQHLAQGAHIAKASHQAVPAAAVHCSETDSKQQTCLAHSYKTRYAATHCQHLPKAQHATCTHFRQIYTAAHILLQQLKTACSVPQ